MNQIRPIYKKELLGYFRSPVGYVILAVFHLMVIGLALYSGYYQRNQASLVTVWQTMPWVLVVFIPATGMRLWSEEKRSGSIELLFTLPISPRAAVLAKFLAALSFICIGLALSFSLAITTGYLGNPDWGVIFSGYIASLLLASAFLSITAVCSSLTENQVITFVISVSICLFATLVGSGWVARFASDLLPTGIVEFIRLLSFEQHFQTMAKGLIDISSLSLYLGLTLACLGINMIVLEK